MLHVIGTSQHLKLDFNNQESPFSSTVGESNVL